VFRDAEEELSGGNVNRVVRVGYTVRRPAGPWTPAVHSLLSHLHEVGFPGAPRPLGVDERGREVLTFIPGEVVWPDRFQLLDANGRLAQVAQLIRSFHDAAESFVPPPAAQWNVLIPADGDDLIVHHDLAPWNLIHTPMNTWAFIDWDSAAPGTRLWDLAYAIHGFIPLSANPDYQRDDTDRRLRTFADAYGLDEQQRRKLVALLGPRSRSMHDFLRVQSARGAEPWTTLWREGHGTVWSEDADWIEQRRQRWEQILLR
jgi:aminoglycoside phosphotransferase (APT) family kinase protein